MNKDSVATFIIGKDSHCILKLEKRVTKLPQKRL